MVIQDIIYDRVTIKVAGLQDKVMHGCLVMLRRDGRASIESSGALGRTWFSGESEVMINHKLVELAPWGLIFTAMGAYKNADGVDELREASVECEVNMFMDRPHG